MPLAIDLIVADGANLDNAKIRVREMILEPGGGDEGRRIHRKFSVTDVSFASEKGTLWQKNIKAGQ